MPATVAPSLPDYGPAHPKPDRDNDDDDDNDEDELEGLRVDDQLDQELASFDVQAYVLIILPPILAIPCPRRNSRTKQIHGA